VKLDRITGSPSLAAAETALVKFNRPLRWLSYGMPGAAVGAILLVGIAFQSEIKGSGQAWIAKLLLVGAPVLLWSWAFALSMFCSSCLDSVRARQFPDRSLIRRQVTGAWLLLFAIPALAGLSIAVSLRNGPRLATLLVFPAAGMWYQLVSQRVILRYMKVRTWSTVCPSIDVGDLATSADMDPSRLMVWESDHPDSHPSACNAIAMGLGKERSVFVFSGLLRVLDSRQVRAIIAHEFAHHARNHYRKSFLWMAAYSGACVLVAASTSSTDADDFGLPALLILGLGGPVLLRAHARAQEFDADRKAAELVPAEDIASALEVLESATGQDRQGLLSKLLATHPPTDQRVSRLRSTVQKR
jgi:Zn-dependent protease with chaperone function